MTITINGTTGIASVDGSAGSPSVRGSDANSGIVYAADTVAVSTGGTERLEVDSSGNIDIPDNGKIRLGGSGDLSLYHDGSHSRIVNGTGELFINSSLTKINNAANNAPLAHFTQGGSVDLYYNGVKKLETSGVGVSITDDTTGAPGLLKLDCSTG